MTRKNELSATMQIATTASTLSANAKANEQKMADVKRSTIRTPMPRHIEAVIR